MPNDRTYYCMCEDKCLFETMTKEQILAAITQAVESHEISDVDTGFVTKLKEKNRNVQLTFWIGTTAEYNAIATKDANCFYILTDDDTRENFDQMRTSLNEISSTVSTLSTERSNRNKPIATNWSGFPTQTDIAASAINNYSVLCFVVMDENGTYIQQILFNPFSLTGYGQEAVYTISQRLKGGDAVAVIVKISDGSFRIQSFTTSHASGSEITYKLVQLIGVF